MPSSNGQSLPSHLKSAPARIDLESLLLTEAYVTSINQFLAENDHKKALRYWLSNFVPEKALTSSDDSSDAILRCIADIDELINEQLNRIIHHPRFQRLEATWRGLWYLVVQAAGTRNIKIKILDSTWSEVSKDINRALEFDQSQLFQKIYSEEYGTPGGEPYGVIIGDYYISHRPSKAHPQDDLSTLEGLAQIASASFAPFIAAASCELFGLDDFSSLGLPLNLDNIFSQTEYVKWNTFRETPDARFVGLTLPRTLMRLPYRTKPGSYKGLYFYEKSSAQDNTNYLWGNACYAFAGILIREFASVGWFGHIRGVPRNQVGGGLITALPVDMFATDADNIASKPLTDVLITDKMERHISDLGFMPLCQCYDTPFAAFYGNQSVQKPKRMDNNEAIINAKLSSMLQHILCGSRIAHYIKVIIRDKVGSFITANDCEEFLREWLFKYTTGREDLDWEEQARYPLRESAVRVREHPEKPGQFLCVIHLRPHYQLDHMVSELELVTELAQTG